MEVVLVALLVALLVGAAAAIAWLLANRRVAPLSAAQQAQPVVMEVPQHVVQQAVAAAVAQANERMPSGSTPTNSYTVATKSPAVTG